jgi:hypothetical protein
MEQRARNSKKIDTALKVQGIPTDTEPGEVSKMAKILLRILIVGDALALTVATVIYYAFTLPARLFPSLHAQQ